MWTCYRFISPNWVLLGGLDTSKNCFGDELYDHMVYMGWISSIDNYDCDGDETFVAVMGKAVEAGEFKWVYDETV